MASNPSPPQILSATPLVRSLIEFEVIIDSPEHGPFFRNSETINKLLSEQKALTTRLNLIYILTFVAACLVLIGPLPADLKIQALGVDAPIGALPRQVVALMMGALFGHYCTQLMSLVVLTQMIKAILLREGREGWMFFSAPFEASTLWGAVVAPKQIGYASPLQERVFAWMIIVLTWTVVASHALTCLAAAYIAFRVALGTGSWWLILPGAGAIVIIVVALIALGAGLFVKMPYRLQAGSAP